MGVRVPPFAPDFLNGAGFDPMGISRCEMPQSEAAQSMHEAPDARFTRSTVLAALLFVVLFGMLLWAMNLIGCNSSIPSHATVPVPTPPSTAAQNVLTYHNDIARTGQDLSETALTPA